MTDQDFIVRTDTNQLLKVRTATARGACDIARRNGYTPKTAWNKDHTDYAQPRYLSRVNAGDFITIN